VKTRTATLLGTALCVLAALLWAGPAAAQKMPKTVVWTAYDVGSAGYSQAASVGHVMSQREGITMRVIPGGNDIARQAPLAIGRAHFGALGIASFLSQEAIMEFAAPEWGPQPVQILGAFWANFNTGVASCAGDAGIKMVSDIKGKRVAWVVGAPALNLNMTGFLAGGGLTWKDVQKIDYPSWGSAARAVREGQADCYIASTNSGLNFELANSPRKYAPAHMPRPNQDPKAWERMKAVTPYFEYNEATIGAEPVSESTPHVGATYGYPIISAYASQPEEVVYQQTRMLFELMPHYKDAFPGNEGMDLKTQRFTWVLPYHAGAVRYFKEKGVWTAAMEKHNQQLYRRQQLLAEAWDKAQTESNEKKVKAADFPALWMGIRAAALKAEGMPVYWEGKFW
jgi:TRAP transporter TAXI family solute receptor